MNGTFPNRSTVASCRLLEGQGAGERRHQAAFTLVELLVVIGIIGLLAGLLLPTLIGTRERARRVQCESNARQFILATQLYGADFQQFLPAAGTDNMNTQDTHTPILSSRTRTNLLVYTGTLKVLDCPNLSRWFQEKPNWRRQDMYGIAIGYHYMGGHTDTPWDLLGTITNQWVSPQKLTDDPALVLLADLNTYCYSYQRILAPHGGQGPRVREDSYFANVSGASNHTPVNIGALGGNVGLLDGSVAWKAISRMRRYRSSREYGEDGAFGMW